MVFFSGFGGFADGAKLYLFKKGFGAGAKLYLLKNGLRREGGLFSGFGGFADGVKVHIFCLKGFR